MGTNPLCTNPYDAELVGLIAAHLLIPLSQGIHIHTDSHSAMQVLQAFAKKSRRRQLKIQNHDLFRILSYLQSIRSTEISWCKAHVGIPGNEVADTLAKAGASGTESPYQAQLPDALPIMAVLHAACRSQITIRLHPVAFKKQTTNGDFTTQLLPTQQESTKIHGDHFKPILGVFQKIAATAYKNTSNGGHTFHHTTELCEAQVDNTLWHKALKGGITSPENRHFTAHVVKLAGSGHISYSDLMASAPEWANHHKNTNPQHREVKKPKTRQEVYAERFEKSKKDFSPSCFIRGPPIPINSISLTLVLI